MNALSKDATIGIVGLGVVGSTMAVAIEEAARPAGLRWELALYDGPKGTGELEDLRDADVVFVCVWTPWRDGGFDQSAVEEVLRGLAKVLERGTPVAVRSTLLPTFLAGIRPDVPGLALVHAPEFLVQADPARSMRETDRIVIGGDVEEMLEAIDVLGLISPAAPVVVCSWEEAALIKLCSNAMLAARVGLSNELATVCRAFGVEWDRVRAGVGLDRRIGPDHLALDGTGGFGGKCLPKDVRGLIAASGTMWAWRPPLLERLVELYAREAAG